MARRTRLTIPEETRDGVRRLLTLSEEEFRELDQALEEAAPTLHGGLLASAIAPKVKIDKGELNEILYTLLSLHLGHEARKASLEKFVEDVCQALQAEDDDSLKPADGNWEPFKKNLSHLLGFEHLLDITSKAFDVMSEHPNIYDNFGTRVLTDIRPIFPKNLEEPLSAAVIVHTLKISYMENNERKEFFVALDSRDVRELQELLKRAEQKAEKLNEVFAAAQLSRIGPETE